MAIRVICKSCGREFRAKDQARDLTLNCPGCKSPIIVQGPRVPNHDVFISYSHKDKVVADGVCAALEQRQVRCWMAPRDILPGADWGQSIIEGIEDARIFVLIFSSNSNMSQQVVREVERAVAKGLQVVPVRIESVSLSKSLEYFLSACHWLDAFTLPIEEHLRQLVTHVKLMLLSETAPPGTAETIVEQLEIPKRHATATPLPSPSPGRNPWPVFAASAVILLLALLAAAYPLLSRLIASAPTASTAPGPSSPIGSTLPASSSPATPAPAAPQPVIPAPAASQPTTPQFTNSLGMNLIAVPAGSFMMGSPSLEQGHARNETLHQVTLTLGFYIGATDVTVGQFRAFADDSHFQTQPEKSGWGHVMDAQSKKWTTQPGVSWRTPKYPQNDNFPVVHVSSFDAIAFCDWLSLKEHRHYHLPTEAQWEYACRAGTNTPYNTGTDERALQNSGWYIGNSGGTPHEVAQKLPNAWGLFDMHGNVRNWCQDLGAAYSGTDETNPAGPAQAPHRVSRGGYWGASANQCRSAARVYGDAAGWSDDRIGFRVVMDMLPSSANSPTPHIAQADIPAAAPQNDNLTDAQIAQRVLELGGKLTLNDGPDFTWSQAPLPDRQFTVVGVDLAPPRGKEGQDDEHLSFLRYAKSIRTLNLANSRITDHALIEILHHNTQLQSLNLWYVTSVTDEGLASIADLPQLEELDIPGTQASDLTLINVVSRLSKLRRLDVGATHITSHGLEAVGELTNLTQLFIGGNPISDLSPLSGLRGLTLLHLGRSQINDDSLRAISGLTNLQTLFLNNTPVTDAGLSNLAGLTHLQTLGAVNTALTDDAIKRVLPNCRILR